MPMRAKCSVFAVPVAVTLLGWAWVAVAYRLAFHGVPPQFGFYHRAHGPNLERWLFNVPMLLVLSGLAVLALFVGRAWLRQGRGPLAALFIAECIACACVFAAPVIWFIDLAGSGNVII